MKSIKSFVYLDEDKMYSISSQLFEGLTDHVLSASKNTLSEGGEQDGEISSGKKMGVILSKEKGTIEKRLLHDFAYNLFEDELNRQGLLYTINEDDSIDSLSDKYFVKISGKVFFDDYEVLNQTMLDFNQICYALGYVQYYGNETIVNIQKELTNIEKKQKDKELKNKTKQIGKNLNNAFGNYLKEAGLLYNQEQLNQMAYVLNYGYKCQFGVRIPLKNLLVSTVLKKEYLKEDKSSLIFKYSRKTEVQFSVIGTVTQTGSERVSINEDFEMDNLKKATQNLIDRISQLEDTFTGRLENECVIDPIAIYREVILPINDNVQEEHK